MAESTTGTVNFCRKVSSIGYKHFGGVEKDLASLGNFRHILKALGQADPGCSNAKEQTASVRIAKVSLILLKATYSDLNPPHLSPPLVAILPQGQSQELTQEAREQCLVTLCIYEK